MTTLLLVEDDPSISTPLRQLLCDRGYSVRLASTLAEASLALQEPVELVLLDWRLPDGDGVDALRTWRQAGLRTPVIIVTARSDVFDRVLGLEHGADDYVVKPFEPRELLARIRARLRTHGPDPVQRFGELHLDAANQKVTYAGIPVSLTRMELALLQFGLAHPRQVFGREELLTAVWGYAPTVASRTVDTHVRQLRAKLRPELIETVRGAGYRFCP